MNATEDPLRDVVAKILNPEAFEGWDKEWREKIKPLPPEQRGPTFDSMRYHGGMVAAREKADVILAALRQVGALAAIAAVRRGDLGK